MSFNIYVKFLSGRTAEVAISSDMRVAELPRLINPLLDPANCRFMWAGMSMDLNGTRTFADYHIAGTCSIHCVFRIPSPASGATVEAHRAANDGLEGCTMTSVGTATPVVYPSAAMKAEWMEPGTQCDSAWSYFATVALGADDGSTLALGLCHSSLDRRLSRMVSADAASALREGKVVTTLPGGVELRQQLCAEEAVFTRGAETVAVAGALVAHAVPPDRICLQKDVYIADSLSLWSADALMASSGRGVDGSMAHFRNLDVNPGSLQVLHDRDGLLCVVFEASVGVFAHLSGDSAVCLTRFRAPCFAGRGHRGVAPRRRERFGSGTAANDPVLCNDGASFCSAEQRSLRRSTLLGGSVRRHR